MGSLLIHERHGRTVRVPKWQIQLHKVFSVEQLGDLYFFLACDATQPKRVSVGIFYRLSVFCLNIN